MQTFELEGFDFIELNKLLKIMQLVGSGGEAKQFIDEGLVQVNGQIETQRRKKLRTGDVVLFEGQEVKIQ
ncbi:MAG: RNA-binding S4 domain-containing protein [Ekhidna sp.]|uniref:RNA-binding S4 domain-containing protein n=1 Tax=Ekhidna sp. TaxID=2608089 RepID=UPI0032ECB409